MKVTHNYGGRPRKPTPMLVMQGSVKALRRRRAEPKLGQMDIPPAPGHLDEVEREAWEFLRAEVNALHATTSADIPGFELMAISLATFRKAAAALRSEGLTVEEIGTKGQTYRKRHALFDVMVQAQRMVWVGMAKYGLNPSDRSRVTDLSAGGGGDLDEFAD